MAGIIARTPAPNSMEADFSPWMEIFRRIETIMNDVNLYSAHVKLKNTDAIELLEVALELLYEQLLPFIEKEFRSTTDAQLEDIRTDLRKWKNIIKVFRKNIYPDELVIKLDKFKRALYITKQYAGLGVPATKHLDSKDKIKLALGME